MKLQYSRKLINDFDLIFRNDNYTFKNNLIKLHALKDNHFKFIGKVITGFKKVNLQLALHWRIFRNHVFKFSQLKFLIHIGGCSTSHK